MGTSTRQRAVAIGAAGVMLVGLAAPASAGFKSGSYSGETTQLDSVGDPYPLLLNVNQKKTKVTGFVEGDRGEPPCSAPFEWQVDAKLKESGRFADKDEVYGYVKGKFEGKKASGTARFIYEPNGCDSGVIDWAAKKN
jgi:hypothetical protein